VNKHCSCYVLFEIALLIAARPVAADPLDALRAQKIAAEQDITRQMDEAVRSGRMTPAQALAAYGPQLDANRQHFNSLDPRPADFNALNGKLQQIGAALRSTGGSPNLRGKDVNADLDAQAVDSKTGTPLAGPRQQQAQDIIRQHVGPVAQENPAKIVDPRTDATYWKPPTPEGEAAKKDDPDAFKTPGGQAATRSPGIYSKDEAGEVLDHRLKTEAARISGDLKTQGKGMAKVESSSAVGPLVIQQNPDGTIARDAQGRPVLQRQAVPDRTETEKQTLATSKALSDYKTGAEAGLYAPGASDADKQKATEAYDRNVQTRMQTLQDRAEWKSGVRDGVRDDLQKGYAQSPDPALRKLGETVGQERADIAAANEDARKKLDTMKDQAGASDRYTGGYKPGAGHPPAAGTTPAGGEAPAEPAKADGTTRQQWDLDRPDGGKSTVTSVTDAKGNKTIRAESPTVLDSGATRTKFTDVDAKGQETRGVSVTSAGGSQSQSSSATYDKDGNLISSKQDTSLTRADGSRQTIARSTDADGQDRLVVKTEGGRPTDADGQKTVTTDITTDGSWTKTTDSRATERVTDRGDGVKQTVKTSVDTTTTQYGDLTTRIDKNVKGSVERSWADSPDKPKPTGPSATIKLAESKEDIYKETAALQKGDERAVVTDGGTDLSAKYDAKLFSGKADKTVSVTSDGSSLKGSAQLAGEVMIAKGSAEGKAVQKIDGIGGAEASLKGDASAGLDAKLRGGAQAGPDGVQADLEAGAFAGFKVKGQGSATLNLNSSLGIKMTGKGEVEGSAGVGAGAKVDAELSWTKIKLGGGANATAGLGGGGKASLEVDAEGLITWRDPDKDKEFAHRADVKAGIIQAVSSGQMQLPPGKKFSDVLPEINDRADWLYAHPAYDKNGKKIDPKDAIMTAMSFDKQSDIQKKIDELAGQYPEGSDQHRILKNIEKDLTGDSLSKRQFARDALADIEDLDRQGQDWAGAGGSTRKTGDASAGGGDLLGALGSAARSAADQLGVGDTLKDLKREARTQAGLAVADGVLAGIDAANRDRDMKRWEDLLNDPSLSPEERDALQGVLDTSRRTGLTPAEVIAVAQAAGDAPVSPATPPKPAGPTLQDIESALGVLNDDTRDAIQRAIDDSPDPPTDAGADAGPADAGPTPRWTPGQLQNDNWNMGTLAGHLTDDIKNLQDQIAQTHDSSARRRLQADLDRKRIELGQTQDRIRDNNQLLADQGVGADGQTYAGAGGLTADEADRRRQAAAAQSQQDIDNLQQQLDDLAGSRDPGAADQGDQLQQQLDDARRRLAGLQTPDGIAPVADPPDDGYDPGADLGDAGYDPVQIADAQNILNQWGDRGGGGSGGSRSAGAGDDGGYTIGGATVGGDNVADESGARRQHTQRSGDHAGRSQSSTDTGDVTDPFAAAANAAQQGADIARNASDTVRAADEARRAADNFGKDDDEDHPHGADGSDAAGPAMTGASTAGGSSTAGSGKPPARRQGGSSSGAGKPPITIAQAPTSGGKPPASNSGGGGSTGGGVGVGWAVYINHDFLGVGNKANFKPGREKIITDVGSESAGYAWLCPKITITYYGMGGFDSSRAEYEGEEYRVRVDIDKYCP
jgi:hypothetical protein